MKKLIVVLLFAAGICFAQTPGTIKVCWTPLNASETCVTTQPDQVTMITIDGRSKPVQAVVVQQIPAYQLEAMQKNVEAQVYNIQNADGTLETRSRFQSVQDLLVQNLIRRIIVPALQLYPATGADTGKNSVETVTADLKAGEQVTPIIP